MSSGILRIDTESDYEKYLSEIAVLMDTHRNEEEDNRFDVLLAAIEEYEALHYPMED